MRGIKFIIIIFFISSRINGFTQENHQMYMRAIAWLVDSGTLVKKNFKMRADYVYDSISLYKSDSSCYFELCEKIQYLGRPNFKKNRIASIDSTIISIPKAELSDSRAFYKKYSFQPYILNLNSNCQQSANYKLILSKPIHNILTVWIAPKSVVLNCEKPKFGNIVSITFVYNNSNEILDYAIASIVIN